MACDPDPLPGPASGDARAAGDEGEATWFLSAAGRGNPSSSLPAWSAANRVRPLVDGNAYFAALHDAVEAARAGDLVLLAAWSGDARQLVGPRGPTVAAVLSAAASRGVQVRGLVWRSPQDRLGVAPEHNRDLTTAVVGAGAELFLDQRVRPLGSHHQKFVVVRHAGRPADDVALVGSFDPASSRRDSRRHDGDPQAMDLGDGYGPRPPWHDASLEVRGPAVHDVETVFRERWEDPAPLSLLPWQLVGDLLRRGRDGRSTLPARLPPPPAAGTCSVQLLRTYPVRWPRYPFAPAGERSVARGHVRALASARRLVYVEEQFLWSPEVVGVLARALRDRPRLDLVLVLPRVPKAGALASVVLGTGQARALALLRAAGGARVHAFDVVNHDDRPVYVHAKISVVDDTWACVRSDNLNRRSWSHDSELSAAVLDRERDERAPADPGGDGHGARRFARDLRLHLMAEHLDRAGDQVDDLLDPGAAVAAMTTSASRLDAWHATGRPGPRPPGRLRHHQDQTVPRWVSRVAYPLSRWPVDPDGRPRKMRRDDRW